MTIFFFQLFEYGISQSSLCCCWWKSVVTLTVFPSYMENSFSLVTFKTFSWFFNTLTKICLRVDQFGFIFLEVNTASENCFPSQFYKFSAIMSTSNFIPSPFSPCFLIVSFLPYLMVCWMDAMDHFPSTFFLFVFTLISMNPSSSLWIISASISNVLLNLSNQFFILIILVFKSRIYISFLF